VYVVDCLQPKKCLPVWYAVPFGSVLAHSDNATTQIEQRGTVLNISSDSGGCTLVVSQCGSILGDCHLGDSIAVNGACLTVTDFDKDQEGGWFRVWLANETLERTSFRNIPPPLSQSSVTHSSPLNDRRVQSWG